MDSDDIGAYLVLFAGAGLLYAASRKKPKPKRKSRKGEECDPLEKSPHGYICVTDEDGFTLDEEAEKFLGFGPYASLSAVEEMLQNLGFPGGDLAGFQRYVSETSQWDLRTDGEIDKQTMLALADAEKLYDAGRWKPPPRAA